MVAWIMLATAGAWLAAPMHLIAPYMFRDGIDVLACEGIIEAAQVCILCAKLLVHPSPSGLERSPVLLHRQLGLRLPLLPLMTREGQAEAEISLLRWPQLSLSGTRSSLIVMTRKKTKMNGTDVV